MSVLTISKKIYYGIFACLFTLLCTQITTFIYLYKKSAGIEVTSQDVAVTSKNVNTYIDEYFEIIHRKQISALYDKYSLAEDGLTTDKRVYGSTNARFTLSEFSDIECGYCKKFHPVPKSIVDNSNGIINWEWNHLPLPMHNPAAFMEAHATECARSIKGNKAFWVYTEQLFQRTKGNGNGAGDLVEIADYVGIDKNLFEQCMKDGRHRELLAAQVQKAESLNINSTPSTFLIDNNSGSVIPIEGQVTADSVMTAIQNHVGNK
ncbi:MAG: protein-disulfide isomerase [Gammaproteobacteria bacterium]|nr:MAG: protein-disulfide isomerase [Gammaproteobacteria bacterium]